MERAVFEAFSIILIPFEKSPVGFFGFLPGALCVLWQVAQAKSSACFGVLIVWGSVFTVDQF